MAGKIIFGTPWVIDSEATKHITHKERIIKSFTKPNTKVLVKIPNGDVVSVQCVDNVDLPNGLNIEHLLHVPDFQCN